MAHFATKTGVLQANGPALRLATALLAFVLALCMTLMPTRAQTLNDPFDARLLSFDEKRVVQAALAFSGNYLGLLDGDWGTGSDRALSNYSVATDGRVNATFGTIGTLLASFGNEVAANDWQMIYLDQVDVSYAHPLNLLRENPDKSRMQFDATDDSFTVAIDFADRTGATAIHAYVYGQGQRNPPPYQNYQDDRLITSVTMPGGLLAYVRSDQVDDGYVTFSIIAADQHRSRLALIASSMQRGRAAQFVLPPNGRLAAILTGAVYASADSGQGTNPFGGTTPPPPAGSGTNPFGGTQPEVAVVPPPPQPPQPPPTPPTDDPEVAQLPPELFETPVQPADPFGNEGPLGVNPPPPTQDWNDGNFVSSGTGFYINRENLVTAAHVVEGCRRMELADHTPLEVLRSEPDLDLAVLKVPGDPAVLFEPGESDVWLELSPELNAKLGETVTALGFPYLGRFGQGLTVTGGNVSALPSSGFGEAQLMISAPVQPGNSGGPLLNADGEVIGVVVARIDDIVVLEETGTLPQNMNFAVTNNALSDFLLRAKVTYPPSDGQGFDLSRGVPESVSTSVVPLFCFE
jgi:serine protease Do